MNNYKITNKEVKLLRDKERKKVIDDLKSY
jgi:hypothetical protein